MVPKGLASSLMGGCTLKLWLGSGCPKGGLHLRPRKESTEEGEGRERRGGREWEEERSNSEHFVQNVLKKAFLGQKTLSADQF